MLQRHHHQRRRRPDANWRGTDSEATRGQLRCGLQQSIRPAPPRMITRHVTGGHVAPLTGACRHGIACSRTDRQQQPTTYPFIVSMSPDLGLPKCPGVRRGQAPPRTQAARPPARVHRARHSGPAVRNRASHRNRCQTGRLTTTIVHERCRALVLVDRHGERRRWVGVIGGQAVRRSHETGLLVRVPVPCRRRPASRRMGAVHSMCESTVWTMRHLTIGLV